MACSPNMSQGSYGDDKVTCHCQKGGTSARVNTL